MKTQLINFIASTIQARKNCINSKNDEWFNRHTQRLEKIEKDILPHGSGLDVGCNIDMDESTEKRVILKTSFHHMDENGFYSGWTDHDIIITPTFGSIDIRITGRNVGDIKDYLGDLFYTVLTGEYEEK